MPYCASTFYYYYARTSILLMIHKACPLRIRALYCSIWSIHSTLPMLSVQHRFSSNRVSSLSPPWVRSCLCLRYVWCINLRKAFCSCHVHLNKPCIFAAVQHKCSLKLKHRIWTTSPSYPAAAKWSKGCVIFSPFVSKSLIKEWSV